jgi:hypothetical protein
MQTVRRTSEEGGIVNFDQFSIKYTGTGMAEKPTVTGLEKCIFNVTDPC